METRTIKNSNGNVITVNNVYTREDWWRDGSLHLKEGDTIEPSVFWQLCESMPPRTWTREIFQPGEAYSHDWTTGRALYQTFEHLGEYYYKYIGLKPAN